MTYQQKLRDLRGASTRARLARESELNYTTLIKAESAERRVKFTTVAEIVRALGYPDDSVEMREVALLWLESVSGIRFGADDATQAIRHIVQREEVKNGTLLDALREEICRIGLTQTEIKLLTWAVSHQPAIEILSHARQLAVDSPKQAPDPELPGPDVSVG